MSELHDDKIKYLEETANKIRRLKSHHIVLAVALFGLFFAALNFNNHLNPFAALSPGSSTKTSLPLFSSLDQFVLAASDKIHLSENVQVSSGDLASNQEIRIKPNNIINSNLFSNQITIVSTSTINGNVSFNNLQIEPTAKILGNTSSPILVPIIKLPAIPNFPTGNQRILISQTSTLSAGNFNEIEILENIQLTLNPGIYNLNKLRLRNNSKLLFSGTTAINIRKELVIRKKALIVQTKNIPSTALQINVQEDKDIEIGKDSLISAKLLAPNSQINLKERITFRGQILAKEIRVGEGSVLSRQDVFIRESDPKKVIIDSDGSEFLVNEVMLNLNNFASLNDAQSLANIVGGRVVGFVEIANAYLLEVFTTTPEELEIKIQTLTNSGNPLLEGAFRNYLFEVF